MKFEKGDIVQVKYTRPESIEQWMRGWTRVGPDDLGVVIFGGMSDTPVRRQYVSVQFPMLGVHLMLASDLVLVQKAETEGNIPIDRDNNK